MFYHHFPNKNNSSQVPMTIIQTRQTVRQHSEHSWPALIIFTSQKLWDVIMNAHNASITTLTCQKCWRILLNIQEMLWQYCLSETVRNHTEHLWHTMSFCTTGQLIMQLRMPISKYFIFRNFVRKLKAKQHS